MPASKKVEERYWDALITITENAIVFHDYYFVGVGKAVPFSEIDAITESMSRISITGNGPSGAGSAGVWFPLDWERTKRDRIFIARLKNKDSQIGFTVQDPVKVDGYCGRRDWSRGKSNGKIGREYTRPVCYRLSTARQR